MKTITILLLAFPTFLSLIAQPIPGETQNIPFLVTCGAESVDSGDDDYSQTIFVSIPENGPDEFFIRVYDPDCGGNHDISTDAFNSETTFEIFGGTGCLSSLAARETSPVGDYKVGTLLMNKTRSPLRVEWRMFSVHEFSPCCESAVGDLWLHRRRANK